MPELLRCVCERISISSAKAESDADGVVSPVVVGSGFRVGGAMAHVYQADGQKQKIC